MTLDELEALTRDFEVKHPRSKLATRMSMSQATWDRITDVVPVTRGDRADIAGPPPTGIPVEITPTLPTDVVRVRYADCGAVLGSWGQYHGGKRCAACHRAAPKRRRA